MALREESLKRRAETYEMGLPPDLRIVQARHNSYRWELPLDLPRAEATITFPETIEDTEEKESTYKSTKAVGVRFLNSLYKSSHVLYDRINNGEEVSQKEVDVLAIRTQKVFSMIESKYQKEKNATRLLAARRMSKKISEVYHEIDKQCILSQKGFDAVQRM